jgi:hypothetical protein
MGELIAVVIMIAGGIGIAIFVLGAAAIAKAENPGRAENNGIPERDRIAASLLFQLTLYGGVPPADALRMVRRIGGLAAPVTAGIDMTNWAERYARIATPEQRSRLLETAVMIVAEPGTPVPLRQYSALLDLSFALGFQTDALARLRERYGFDYIDPAKYGRPRSADRAGGAPLFVREPPNETELLRVLGIEGTVSRQTIITAYRKLAAQHHPDRFFGEPEEAQSSAAARFIEITRAYEALLLIYRD